MIIYVKEKDGRKRAAVERKCKQCKRTFLAKKRFVDKGEAIYCSLRCSQISRRNRISKKCAYCGKKVERALSKIKSSKSGLFFCSRKCKEIAQSFVGNIKEIRPSHYKDAEEGINQYRKTAFHYYEHKCNNCGWNEDERILQVHHKNEDRKDNRKENLIILCPTCHAKLTMKLYVLNEELKIIPI